MDNICSADLAAMQLLSRYNKLYCTYIVLNDVFSKHLLIFPLKNKNVETITKAFQKILVESGR